MKNRTNSFFQIFTTSGILKYHIVHVKRGLSASRGQLKQNTADDPDLGLLGK